MPDIFSWWCDNDGGKTLGKAFVGTLCTWSSININEKLESYAASGFVSKIRQHRLSGYFVTITLLENY